MLSINRKWGFVLIGIWILSIVITYNVGVTLGQLEIVFEPITETEPIKIDGKNRMFVKKYTWGLLGNHSNIYLTNSAHRNQIDENEDQILSRSGAIFFQVSNDTLRIYCRTTPNINPNCRFEMPVKYIKLENPEFMNLYDQMSYQLKCSDWM